MIFFVTGWLFFRFVKYLKFVCRLQTFLDKLLKHSTQLTAKMLVLSKLNVNKILIQSQKRRRVLQKMIFFVGQVTFQSRIVLLNNSLFSILPTRQSIVAEPTYSGEHAKTSIAVPSVIIFSYLRQGARTLFQIRLIII